jgi:GntR family transcriptional regulator
METRPGSWRAGNHTRIAPGRFPGRRPDAKTRSEITGLSSSDLASLANMSQELTGPHAPYMLIVYALADKIKSGELKPGDRMPSVTELIQTYSVSHSTARRALAKLKDMGLTDTVPGYATFVRLPGQDRPS